MAALRSGNNEYQPWLLGFTGRSAVTILYAQDCSVSIPVDEFLVCTVHLYTSKGMPSPGSLSAEIVS